MNELDLDTEQNEAAWGVYLSLIASGASKNEGYLMLAESAFIAVEAFRDVQERHNNGV